MILKIKEKSEKKRFIKKRIDTKENFESKHEEKIYKYKRKI